MNTLKKYYWIAKPSDVKNALEDTKRQLDRSVVVQIRTCILQLIDHFMFKLPPDCDEKDVEREEEFQRILNFVSLVREVAITLINHYDYEIFFCSRMTISTMSSPKRCANFPTILPFWCPLSIRKKPFASSLN
jgi:hypothetical protein